jgi:hypothetical protein
MSSSVAARRWPLDLCYGEQAVQPRQQVSVYATNGPSGGRCGSGWRRRRLEGGPSRVRQWRTAMAAFGVPHEGSTVRYLKAT